MALALASGILSSAAEAQSTLSARLSLLRDSLDATLWRAETEALAQLPLDTFSLSAREALERLLTLSPAASSPELFRLAGALGLQTGLRDAAAYLDLPPDMRELRKLALVRAGDETLGTYFDERVTAWPVDQSYVTEVLPMVIYARRRAGFDYLWAELSVANRACRSLDPNTSAREDCGYRLLEALAPVTEDFPLALTWDGALDTDDYPAALELARDWFRAHRDTYALKTDRL